MHLDGDLAPSLGFVMNSLAGQLLIASPFLDDGNFNKSVVLIIQHSEDGAFGLVLNRPTEHRVQDVWEVASEESFDTDAVVHCGGPVDGPLMAIHTQKSCSEHRILRGVHFSASKDHLCDVIQKSQKTYRIFSGYSGWAASQLDAELEQGAWLTHPASFEHIFAHDDVDLWKNVAHEIGNEVVLQQLKIKRPPNDPSMN